MKVLNNFLKKRALDFTRNKTTLERYGLATLAVLILGIATSAASIYSSTGFFAEFGESFTNNGFPIWVPIVIASLIEVFTVMLLYPLLGSIIKHDWWDVVVILPFAVLFYGLNFYTSTTGLKNKAETKTDATYTINQSFSTDSARIYNNYYAAVDSFNKVNAKLSLKNTVFNHDQLKHNQAQIVYLNAKFDRERATLETNKHIRQEDNRKKVNLSGLDNYRYIVTNQILQLVFHLLVVIFYHIVASENRTLEQKMEQDIKPKQEKLFAKIRDSLMQRAMSDTEFIANQIAHSRDISESESIGETTSEKKKPNPQQQTPFMGEPFRLKRK